MKPGSLKIYNSFTREKEDFEPIKPPLIGMYVCGPTVYSDVHLGNCRTFVSFDVIYRYLMQLGYKVRYVRNITDVGHLENDSDTHEEDKISKKARLEKLEPMEVVQYYTKGFHRIMAELNALDPSIEPSATGHILEQIEMVQTILDNGFAYEVNGSVYFDTLKMIEAYKTYGQLSGKKQEDLLVETRDLKNQSEKRHPSDFAIWVKADEKHIMRWNSPWSEGFPGWHLECSVMSTKYLGEKFDIHGGGMDLQFPHHENEIAQNLGACGNQPAKYWMHTNMLLMNGKKMSKTPDSETGISNSITPEELFEGSNSNMSKAYSPMVVRFFMLQSHYRSTLDLSDEALQAAEKGFMRLMEANKVLQQLEHPGKGATTEENDQVNSLLDKVYEDMSDDFNTPKALANLFALVNKVNSFSDGHLELSSIAADTLDRLKETFRIFIFDVFGLNDEVANANGKSDDTLDGLMDLVLDLRQDSRARKDWPTADKIRDALTALKIQVKDGKEGSSWTKSL